MGGTLTATSWLYVMLMILMAGGVDMLRGVLLDIGCGNGWCVRQHKKRGLERDGALTIV